MEIEDISKTFLLAYKDIPRMIKSLDKCIDHAVMSGLGCSHIYNGITTDMLYEKIIVFKNRQDILATIQETTKNILLKMDKNNAKFLIERYVQKMSNQQIAKNMKCSLRSVYRNIKKALNEFSYYLKVEGYSDDTWFRGESFIESIIEYLPKYENIEPTIKVENKVMSKTYKPLKQNRVISTIMPCNTVQIYC